jgi:small subunit ribosomal protein S11
MVEKKEKIEDKSQAKKDQSLSSFPKGKKLDQPEETSKKKTKEIEAVVNIYTSFNNTLVHVTDMSGKTITKITGGVITKHDRLKANPTIAMFIAKRITENIKDLGIKSLYVRIRAKTRNPAPGPGAHAIIKSLSREGFRILNILDTTRVPRGGPKKKGGRRGRRP